MPKHVVETRTIAGLDLSTNRTVHEILNTITSTSGQSVYRGATNWEAFTLPVYAPYTVTFSATPTFNYNNSKNQEITLTGDITSITLSNIPDGDTLFILFKQDGTGSRTITGWPANTKVIDGGAGAVTLTPTASAWDLIGIKKWGSNYLVTYGKNYS